MRRCIYDDVECRLSREGLGRHGDKMHNVWHQRYERKHISLIFSRNRKSIIWDQKRLI